jgi:hypothetical protein
LDAVLFEEGLAATSNYGIGVQTSDHHTFDVTFYKKMTAGWCFTEMRTGFKTAVNGRFGE